MGYGGYPVHSYGSDAIMSAWREAKSRNEVEASMRNKAITQAILEGAASGEIANFRPGTPAYTGIEKQFGGQLTQGLMQRGQRATQARQMEEQVRNFETGMKFFNVANQVYEDLGEKAGPWIQKAYAQAQKYLQGAGMDVDINALYDVKTNQENVNKAATARLGEIIGDLSEKSTPQQIAQARIAVVKFQEAYQGKEEKEKVDVAMKTLDDLDMHVRNRITQEHQKALTRERPKSAASPAFKKLAYADWISRPENRGKGYMEFETEWRGKGIDAKIEAFINNVGRQPSADEVRRLLIADPWGFLAPTEPSVEQPEGLPEQAKSQLREGEVTVFRNGEQWTLIKGKPVKISK